MQLLQHSSGTEDEEPQDPSKGFWRKSLVEREMFVICLLVFGASMATIISSQDAIQFALTWSLATSRTIWLDGSYSGAAFTVNIGLHTYSALPAGLSFLTFPVVSLAQLITTMDPSASGVYIATYFSSIFGALAAVLFYKSARLFGPERVSAFLTISFAFGTSLWIYSRIYLPEALATCIGLASVYCVLRASQMCSAIREVGNEEEIYSKKRPKVVNAVIPLLTFTSAILLGMAVFVDNMAIFFFVPIFFYVVLGIWPPQLTSKLVSIFSFLIGTTIGLIPTLVYDFLTTGNAVTAPYGIPFIGGVQLSSYTLHFGQGLYNALISPASGLILFTPFVMISLLGFFYLMRENLGEAFLFCGLYVSILIPVSLVSSSTYFLQNIVGPSELVIAMPFILLPAISLLNRMKMIGFGAVLSCILGVASILITGLIALTDPVLGPAGILSATGGASPVISTNIPLFLDHSFLTWWSFYQDSFFYAILMLAFPIVLLLSYWFLAEIKIRRSQQKKSIVVEPQSVTLDS
jgi:hypothetical protein